MNCEKIRPKWRLWLATCLLLLFSGAANASSPYNNCTSPQLPSLTTSQAKSWSGLPIGATIPGSDISLSIQINCSAASDADQGCYGGTGWELTTSGYAPGSTAISNTYTYPGLNDGIGFQILGEDNSPVAAVSTSSSGAVFSLRQARPVDGSQSVRFLFRMIKLKTTIAPGLAPSGRFFLACSGKEYANITQAQSVVNMSTNVTRITQACVPAAYETSVALPSVSRTSFKGVGDTARRTSFNLGFKCDADAHALVAFTDGAKPGNTGSAVSLNQNSSATGIGVQLFSNGVAIQMTPNELFSVGGTHLTIDSEAGASQVVNLPMAAEYVQTDPEITPGTVEASVLVNIAYQ